MSDTREVLKIVVVGHVDHGKSTVIGRLLYDTKSLPEGAIERVKRISKEKGKPFEYAYLLDAFEEEQKQGITIDTTQLQFQTEKRDYVIIDAPGHKEFLKNMISGASSAEAALLIIDANEGIQEQSKRHGYILSLLGIEKVYVIVNKMDLINYSELTFIHIREKMDAFFKQLNVYPLKYIPISAFHGENLTHKSEKMPWYQGEPVLEAMDLFEKDKGLEDQPLRFPVQDVYKFDHRRIIAGRIESGRLHVGDEILISPGNKLTRVKAIEYWAQKDKGDTVEVNMSVGITVEDELFNKRGAFITHPDSPPAIGNVFKGNIFWMGKNPLVKNKVYKLKLVTQEVECEIAAIHKVTDATSLRISDHAGEVKLNDVAEVTVRTKETICFDEFRNHHNTGRFVLVDGYDVSGGGIISKAEQEEQQVGKFISDDGELPVQCFDEYYYVPSQGTIRRVERHPDVYRPGNPIPTVGDTYAYPSDFDLLDLVAGLVAQIRNGKFATLQEIGQYNYSGKPVINKQGFEIKVSSQADFLELKNESTALQHGGMNQMTLFANKWLDFSAYRNVRYKEI
jgi:bifunctional enzyme CysN/CysC/sulfate adenylyltransferase subunit 1